MMNKRFLFLIFLLLFIYGCKETSVEFLEADFYFEEPQPINDSELKKIPSKFFGQYNLGENDVLNITENHIINSYESVSVVSKSEFDTIKSEGTFKNGKFYLKGSRQLFDVTYYHDSIRLKTVYRDTIFSMAKNHKAKRINGLLVLSHKDSVFWKVNILSIKKDSLRWKKFGLKEDYAFLKKKCKRH